MTPKAPGILYAPGFNQWHTYTLFRLTLQSKYAYRLILIPLIDKNINYENVRPHAQMKSLVDGLTDLYNKLQGEKKN